MNKALKWILILGGGLLALVIISLLVIPMFVDVQTYKPQIEKKVSEATGRSFAIGGDIQLSLFPWVGVALSDVRLGNPPDFKEKDFASVQSFEVRVKLLPLISKDIQVKRFIVEAPRIALVKRKDGRTSWEGLGKPSSKEPKPSKEPKKDPGKSAEALPIKALAVGEFAIEKGTVLWVDEMKGERREISDLSLRLEDVSLDRPIQLALSASLDGKPLSLTGKVGPVGKEPGKGTMPVDLSVKALRELEMNLKGKMVDPATRQAFDMAVQVSPFSPRKLVKALGQDFPVQTADPQALQSVAFKGILKGNPQSISVSDGIIQLDDSRLDFTARAKDFSRPDLAFDLRGDKIDLDRYLPPSGEKKAGAGAKKPEAPKSAKKKTDYGPLRKMVLDGTVKIGELKVKGAKAQDIQLKVSARNGVFRLDPFTLRLYQGDVASKGSFDVRQDVPQTNMAVEAKGIQVNPFLKDLMQKDFLEGTVKASMDIAMAGDDPDRIKGSLNGKGDLLFNDGAIVGIDLGGMVRNVKATFGLAEKAEKRPRTAFSELHSPFTITNGLVDTPKTSLSSPLLRVLAAGKADLVKETLDFRVEPKFVATLKGQGDTKERSGVSVPVLVTGNFSSPKFRPDLKGMLEQKLGTGISEPSDLKKLIPGQSTKEGKTESVEEKAKGILKGLPFGR